MRAAAIDVGTNSIKMAVGQATPGGPPTFIKESIIISRLGKAVDSSGAIDRAAAERSIDAIAQLLREAKEWGAEQVRVVATSALRDASNSAEFTGAVQERLGARVEVLSGEDECRYSYLAAAGGFEGRVAAVDCGGGSTEIAVGENNQLTSCTSINIGAVRLHERFLHGDPPPPAEISAAKDAAEGVVRTGSPGGRFDSVIGIGGSAVNLGRMVRRVPVEKTEEVGCAVLTEAEIAEAVEMLGGMAIEERKRLVGLDPERADIILAGAIILDRVLTVLGCDRMTVSIRGLRHGVLMEMLEGGR